MAQGRDVKGKKQLQMGQKHHYRVNLILSPYGTHTGRWKLKPNKKCKLQVIVHRTPEKTIKITCDLVHRESAIISNPDEKDTNSHKKITTKKGRYSC